MGKHADLNRDVLFIVLKTLRPVAIVAAVITTCLVAVRVAVPPERLSGLPDVLIIVLAVGPWVLGGAATLLGLIALGAYVLAKYDTKNSAKYQTVKETLQVTAFVGVLWSALTLMAYFWSGAKYYETTPFLVFCGWSTLLLCAVGGIFAAIMYLIDLCVRRIRAMDREIEDERTGKSQITGSRKTIRAIQSIVYVGVLPVLASLGAYKLVEYGSRYDKSGPIIKSLGYLFIVGFVYFLSFVLGMGLTGRRVNLSDKGLDRIQMFVMDTVALLGLILLMRACSTK